MTINIEQLKKEIIKTASEELIPRFQKIDSRRKIDGSLVTEADLAVQQRLTQSLNKAYPQIPLLGEEMPTETQQQILEDSPNGFWCLDPLDGTSNYVAGMPCFATSLAYIRRDEVEIGIIYDPLRDECFHAIRGEGAWLNGKPLHLENTSDQIDTCVAMVDFKRLSEKLASQLATRPPYRSQRSIGSVALDWCWLAAGRLELYLHGGSKLWDYSAGSLIFSEAGGLHRLTEGAVSLPAAAKLGLSPKMAIAAPNEALFEAWRDWLSQYD
ncbi:MAG: inositol monophosphatase family protein [Candidatus Thiodiazotropha sp. (ex Monitilora ramsayi)]|nr:inositol monophosphatase family protein [Candidatus Thiodiazotropha sp. (ex Monitilora ramsayi)]